MDEFEHPILSKGRYRLLALTSQPQYACDAITGYAVATLAGDRLRVEATLSQARAWLETGCARRIRPSAPGAADAADTTGRRPTQGRAACNRKLFVVPGHHRDRARLRPVPVGLT